MIGSNLAMSIWPGLKRAGIATVTATYLFSDEFTTDEAAPLTSPRTCEPGPGTANMTGATAYISGGKWYSQSETAWIVGAQSQPVACGLGMFTGGTEGSGGGSAIRYFGWWRATTTVANFTFGSGMRYDAVAYGYGHPAFNNIFSGSNNSEGFVHLFRSQGSGGFLLVKGDVFTEWTLLWVNNSNFAQANVWPKIGYTASSGANSLDSLKTFNLEAPWDTDNGIATDEIAAPVDDDIFTHEADCLIEITIDTLQTASTQLNFRRQDADNKWKLLLHGNGGLYLQEIVGGGATNRANSATGILAAGSRVVVVCDKENIYVYHNNTQVISYAAAANFQTAISGNIEVATVGGGVYSNLITWPRVISGAALNELKKYTGA